MKKILCVVLIIFLILTGCGKRPDNDAASVSPSSIEAASDTTQASSEVSVPEDSNGEPGGDGTDDEDWALQTVTITVPEGYTLARIAMLLEEKKICTVDEFIEATQTGDFSEYDLIAQQQDDPNRCFKLEGYLFPDTYEVYQQDAPEAVIHRILQHTEQKIDYDLRQSIEQSGYTVDQILTMASIIEKEAFGIQEMGKISSVLHNRLDSGMRLQCDVTIVYVEGAIKPFITGDIDRYNNYYNTFKCEGLPAGAICNPGLDAIKAALQPEDTEYLFFVTDADKNYYYSGTYEEHLEKVESIKLSESE